MFPYPQNPEDWQTAYTRDQAFRDSGKHAGISTILLLVSTFVISVFLIIRLYLLPILSELHFLFRVFIPIGLLIVSFIILVCIQSLANRLAADLFAHYYQTKEGIDPKKLIEYRLYGRMKLPTPLNRFQKFESVTSKEGRIEKDDTWAAWSARHLGGPISLTVFDGCALYLERGNRFSRVVGPGEKAPFLEWYETIKYPVDLRPKVKEGSFGVWTKDGIKVTITARLECRVGPEKKDGKEKLVFPYDPVSVKKAVEHYALNWPAGAKEPEELSWIDAAWSQVVGILPAYIGSRVLDDLIIAERNKGQILSPDATRQFMESLNNATSSFGVYVTDFQIKQIVLPTKITEQQTEYWSAERQSINKIIDGKAKADVIRTLEEAHSEAQRDLILAIADGLEKNPTKQFAESLLLSLAGILDESLTDPHTRATLAKDTLETLEKLQKMLG
jgi:regulator of protease activity HflC (stomatin/prohibitin superfamily)